MCSPDHNGGASWDRDTSTMLFGGIPYHFCAQCEKRTTCATMIHTTIGRLIGGLGLSNAFEIEMITKRIRRVCYAKVSQYPAQRQ